MKDITVYTTASEDDDLPHRVIYGVRIDGQETILEQDEAKRLFACLDTALGGHVIGEQIREAQNRAVDQVLDAIRGCAEKSRW